MQTGVQIAVRPLALRALFGITVAELREQMCELGSWDERFTALDGYLRGLLPDRRRGISHGLR